MKLRKTEVLIALIPILFFATSLYFYAALPDLMASHWGADGQVNGYMEKPLAVFLVPIISLLLVGFFIAIPRIDPLKKNIATFRTEYEGLIVVIMLFLFGVHLQTLLWNIGILINPSSTIPAGVSLLFIYLGLIMRRLKRNWFIGIRTPWTLNSDAVWEKTHKLGSYLFVISGLIALIGVFLGDIWVWTLVFPIVASTLVLFVYSYLEYKKEGNSPNTKV